MKLILTALIVFSAASPTWAASPNCQMASVIVTQAIVDEAKRSDRGILAASLFSKHGGGEAFIDGLAAIYEEDVCLYIRNASDEALRKMADKVLANHANGKY